MRAGFLLKRPSEGEGEGRQKEKHLAKLSRKEEENPVRVENLKNLARKPNKLVNFKNSTLVH